MAHKYRLEREKLESSERRPNKFFSRVQGRTQARRTVLIATEGILKLFEKTAEVVSDLAWTLEWG